MATTKSKVKYILANKNYRVGDVVHNFSVEDVPDSDPSLCWWACKSVSGIDVKLLYRVEDLEGQH